LLLSLALSFRFDFGAGIARKESIVCLTSLSEPFFQRFAVALPINMTAFSDPSGIVATSNARRGISAFVDCERDEKVISIHRRLPSTVLDFTLMSVGDP